MHEAQSPVDIIQLIVCGIQKLLIDEDFFRMFDDEAVGKGIRAAAALTHQEQILFKQTDPIQFAGCLGERRVESNAKT
ncbi:MAG: hypothetical protein BWY83_01414 [bacterium ADurb.Bin478]|nr:MAG: hypothetical protein BWY83_01414 [bacterium ADurb.Bin478]